MKSVLISIQPKWCELIASGKKTVEVRKSAPRLETPFKCYIYQTKAMKDIQYKLTSISRYVSKEKRKKCFCKWLNAEYLQINIKAEEVKEANNDE